MDWSWRDVSSHQSINKLAPISIERVDSRYLSTNSSVICLTDGQKIIVKTITNVTNPNNNDNKGKGCFGATLHAKADE